MANTIGGLKSTCPRHRLRGGRPAWSTAVGLGPIPYRFAGSNPAPRILSVPRLTRVEIDGFDKGKTEQKPRWRVAGGECSHRNGVVDEASATGIG